MSLLPISFPQLPRSPPTTSRSTHHYYSSKEIEILLRNRFETQHKRYVPSIGSSIPQRRKVREDNYAPRRSGFAYTDVG